MTESEYKCFNCGANAVMWVADFTFEDYGYEDDYGNTDGIIHECCCTNCGAEIVYYVPERGGKDGENV